MASALDTAQYILEEYGPTTTMKLQKLVYYSQAWSVVWDDDTLFDEKIEAWKNGPVVRELWEEARGQFRVDATLAGNSSHLSETQKETVNRVLAFYADKDAQWLSDLTHMEDPWKEAYSEGRNTEISLLSLSEYYSSIEPDEQATSAD